MPQNKYWDELSPCPLCQGEAKVDICIRIDSTNILYPVMYARCRKCGFSMEVKVKNSFNDAENEFNLALLLALWNRLASLTKEADCTP